MQSLAAVPAEQKICKVDQTLCAKPGNPGLVAFEFRQV